MNAINRVLPIALCIVMVVIVTSIANNTASQPQPDHMILRELTIVDSQGRPRIRLWTEYDQPHFALIDEEGKRRCEIGMFIRGSGAHEHGPGIYLSGKKQPRNVGMTVGRFDNPSIGVGAPGKTSWMQMTVIRGGEDTSIEYYDRKNNVIATAKREAIVKP